MYILLASLRYFPAFVFSMLALAYVIVFIAIMPSKMCEVAELKGYNAKEKHIFAICFWFGIFGFLYVLALPDLKTRSAIEMSCGMDFSFEKVAVKKSGDVKKSEAAKKTSEAKPTFNETKPNLNNLFTTGELLDYAKSLNLEDVELKEKLVGELERLYNLEPLLGDQVEEALKIFDDYFN